MTTVTGVDQGWTVLTGSGVGGTHYYGLAAATFRLSGGLECAWSAQASGIITVRILPDAAAQWLASQKDLALFQPQRNAFGDGSYSTCMGSGCFVNVLQGDHWLQFAAR